MLKRSQATAPAGCFLLLERTDVPRQEILVVLGEDPEEGAQAVRRRGVPLLVPVDREPLRTGGEAEQRGDGQVLIHPLDVGVGVVGHVVGDLPHVAIGAEEVEARAQDGVDPVAVGVRPVERVVRDAEPDAGHRDPHQHDQSHRPGSGDGVGQEEEVAPDEGAEDDDGLEDHRPVGLVRFPRHFEPLPDRILEIGHERRRLPAREPDPVGDVEGRDRRSGGGSGHDLNLRRGPLRRQRWRGVQGVESPSEANEPGSAAAPPGVCIGTLNHLFFWPELYRRTGRMSIVFLFDENPDVASAGSGGAAVGGARSVPDQSSEEGAVGSRGQPVFGSSDCLE